MFLNEKYITKISNLPKLMQKLRTSPSDFEAQLRDQMTQKKTAKTNLNTKIIKGSVNYQILKHINKF